LLVVLSINRKALIRPNVLLCLVTLLVVGTVVTTLQPEHFGTIYRTVRYAGYVATLWLLTPWWGRRDVLLLRCHLRTLVVLTGSVLLGLFVAPGTAQAGGRAGRCDLAHAAHPGGPLLGGGDRASGRALVAATCPAAPRPSCPS
jgi:drug/metabolite transporter superfamily protein YnfA